ncbi:hypothetical protein D3C76_1281860 [compost metagenome]
MRPAAEHAEPGFFVASDGLLVELEYAQHDVVKVQDLESVFANELQRFGSVPLSPLLLISQEDPDLRYPADRIDGKQRAVAKQLVPVQPDDREMLAFFGHIVQQALFPRQPEHFPGSP